MLGANQGVSSGGELVSPEDEVESEVLEEELELAWGVYMSF